MYDALLILIFVFITGACIGSFLNVVALRALSEESIVFPPSKCPECKNPIKWFDNIPIFSYLFTFKGKCRNCGCKVSVQYPIVEVLTAILFVICVIAFGLTLKTLLILILICMGIVLSITDIKEHVTFDVHLWIFIAACIITSLYLHDFDYVFVELGILAGVVFMEIIARGSYFLMKKRLNADETDDEEINEYIHKNKRLFGSGDTYLSAAAGALLGWKYVIFSVIFAIILQALMLIPNFFIKLFKNKQYSLFALLTSLFILFFAYMLINNLVTLNLIVMNIFLAVIVIIGVLSVIKLRNNSYKYGLNTIPFGPAIIISMFLVLFFGNEIYTFIKNYIFLING